MTIDIAKLRALIDVERRSEWLVDVRYIFGNGTKYSFGEFEETTQADLAVAAVNALPELLASYELMQALLAEADRVRVANKLLIAAVVKVCDDTDWCPLCEHHPSTHHHETCVLARST